MKRHKTLAEQQRAPMAFEEALRHCVAMAFESERKAKGRFVSDDARAIRTLLRNVQPLPDTLGSAADLIGLPNEAESDADLFEAVKGNREMGQRLEELHEILDRKNKIIRLLALGDLTTAELVNDMSNDNVALLPQNHA